MKQLSSLVNILVVLVAVCRAQDRNLDNNPCNDDISQLSCDDCISASHLCSWCPYFPNISIPDQRCRMTDPPSSCPGVNSQNPLPETMILKDEELTTSATQLEGVDSIQVSPQNISLSLRRGLPSSFNMTFHSLPNTPLDLYFLVDLSSSQNFVVFILRDDLPEIGKAVGNISTNFQMGYGSFVDKNAIPYALSDYRENNSGLIECRSFGECAPTYSFRNSQPLTPSVTELNSTFNEFSELSSNIDNPEGGLEALLQVAVCTNETGWRPNALHMVFMITDQGFHFAGDGRLAGILQPNDGLCHQEVGETGRLEYTHGLLQDYPSLLQVRNALETNLIVPIFTLRTSTLSGGRVNESLLPSYMNLVQNDLSITGAQAIVFSDNTVEEIVRVIQESYERTVQSIRVNIPTIPGYSFTVDPIEGCGSQSDGSCQLLFDEEVTYRVTVNITDCSLALRNRKQVQLLGPPFSFSTINLQPLCGCPCTDVGAEVSSNLCSNSGDLLCGLCTCNSTFGDQCECGTPVTVCSMAADPTGNIRNCSGRGTCSTCGDCRCFDDAFGLACQCTDISDCDDSCSGNGRCTCGRPDTFPVCECLIAPLSEIPFFERTVGNPGNCECNPDNCFNPQFPDELCHFITDNSDGREFCGCTRCNCPNLFEERDNLCVPQEECNDFVENCARCRLGDIDNTTSMCAECPKEVPFLGEDTAPTANVSRQCDYTIGNCEYTFFLSPDGNMVTLSFTRIRCTNRALPWIITGSLVGAIILLGLLFLVILKILLMVWDRHEYKRFTQELKDADFAPVDNPLYLTPQQDYVNPLRRPSKRVAPPE